MRKTLEGEHNEEAWEGGVVIGGYKLTNLRYANDTTLITSKVEEMVISQGKLEAVNRDYGLEINQSKTQIMIVDYSNNNRLEINKISGVEVVDHFKYLSSDVDNRGGCKHEIYYRW